MTLDPEEVKSQVDTAKGDESSIKPSEHAVEAPIDGDGEKSQSDSKSNKPAATKSNEDLNEENKTNGKSTSTTGKPSKRVEEAQAYNRRDRRYLPSNDRKPYRKNNKSELISQEESSDPAAIRKQVGWPRNGASCSELIFAGRVLLFRLKSSPRQISLHEG